MKVKDVTITKSALARALKCAPSSISNLVNHGLPVRADGRLDRRAALIWIVNQTSGAGGGWNSETRGKADLRERAQALLSRKGTGRVQPVTKRGSKSPRPAAAKIQSGMVAEQSPGTAVAGDDGASLAGYTRTVQREVLDLLRAKAAELPALLHKLGAPPLAVLLAAEIWDAVFFAALSPRIVELYGPRGPAPIVEGADQELAEKLGIPFDPEMTKMIEDCLDEANKFLWPRGTDPAA